MPFDGTGFPTGPEKPSHTSRQEKLWAAFVIAVSVFLLIMPISASGFVDLVQYVRGH